MDLDDLEHNTRDGIHIASVAGTWIAAVAGFGGMRDHGGQLAFAPAAALGASPGLRFRHHVPRTQPAGRGQPRAGALLAARRRAAGDHPSRRAGDGQRRRAADAGHTAARAPAPSPVSAVRPRAGPPAPGDVHPVGGRLSVSAATAAAAAVRHLLAPLRAGVTRHSVPGATARARFPRLAGVTRHGPGWPRAHDDFPARAGDRAPGGVGSLPWLKNSTCRT